MGGTGLGVGFAIVFLTGERFVSRLTGAGSTAEEELLVLRGLRACCWHCITALRRISRMLFDPVVLSPISASCRFRGAWIRWAMWI